MLDLIHPVYQPTAAYGHFGRAPYELTYTGQNGESETATAFSWERVDLADKIKSAVA
jgi:S-adenosylmethionine synthetase